MSNTPEKQRKHRPSAPPNGQVIPDLTQLVQSNHNPRHVLNDLCQRFEDEFSQRLKIWVVFANSHSTCSDPVFEHSKFRHPFSDASSGFGPAQPFKLFLRRGFEEGFSFRLIKGFDIRRIAEVEQREIHHRGVVEHAVEDLGHGAALGLSDSRFLL